MNLDCFHVISLNYQVPYNISLSVICSCLSINNWLSRVKFENKSLIITFTFDI